MMEKWNGCPAVLKRRICFTLLAGPASVIVSLIIYLAYADTVLLTMSGAIFICCLYRGKVLWDIIRREAYIAVSGTCTGVTLSPLRRYRRVRITDLYGREQTLLLSGQTAVQIGSQYCFYFQKENRPLLGNDYLDTMLATNAFIGYEKLMEHCAEME